MSRPRSILNRPALESDAFITSVVRYGERDCIARLMLRDRGRIVAFFKNGMGNKRGVGALQAPCMARVAYIDMSDNKMRRLQSFDIDPESYALSLKSFAYVSYLAEVIERMLPEEEPAESVFALIEGAWSALAQLGAQASILRAFEMHLLDFCGYLPDFDEIDSLDCGQIYYDPVACRLSEEPLAQSFIVTRSAIMLARDMLENKIGQVESDNFADLLSLGRIFRSRLSVLGIKELKSVSFMKQLAKK